LKRLKIFEPEKNNYILKNRSKLTKESFARTCRENTNGESIKDAKLERLLLKTRAG
jgi:hypothetical protein